MSTLSQINEKKLLERQVYIREPSVLDWTRCFCDTRAFTLLLRHYSTAAAVWRANAGVTL